MGAPLSWKDVWEPPGDTAQDDLPLPAMRVSVPAPVGTLSGVQILEQYAGRAGPRGREGASPRCGRLVRTAPSGRDLIRPGSTAPDPRRGGRPDYRRRGRPGLRGP